MWKNAPLGIDFKDIWSYLSVSACIFIVQLRQLKKLQATQRSLHHKLGIGEGNSQGEWDLQVPGKCFVGIKLQLHCSYWCSKINIF